MGSKRFDQDTYNKHDALAKQYANDLWWDISKKKLSENHNEGSFQCGFWDLRGPNGLYIESEIKVCKINPWGNEFFHKTHFPFLYEGIDFAARKNKNRAVDGFFCSFNINGTLAYMVKGHKLICPSNLIKKNTCLTMGEEFYRCPLKLGRFFEKKNNKWQLWSGNDS